MSNAGGNNGVTAASARAAGKVPRPPDAEQDASYYAARSKAFASAGAREIDRTDFRRFRRGRLYTRSTRLGPDELALQSELASASADGDFSAVLTLTAKTIANDPSDIHSHMLRMIALEDSQRSLEEAEFHRGMARALLSSILSEGDGRDFDSAWTAFSVNEEYAVLRALGYRPESQALLTRGDRRYDVLEARKLDTGESTSLHFDITELYGEERRLAPLSSPGNATRTPPSAAPASPSIAPPRPRPARSRDSAQLIGAGPGGKDSCSLPDDRRELIGSHLAQLQSCTAMSLLDAGRSMFAWLTFNPDGSARFQLGVKTSSLAPEVSTCILEGLSRVRLAPQGADLESWLVPIYLEPGKPPRLGKSPSELAGTLSLPPSPDVEEPGTPDVAWLRAVHRNDPFFTACGLLSSDRNTEPAGEMDVAFTIGPQGDVERLALVSSTFADCQVTECLGRAVVSMHFPEVPPGPEVRRLRFVASGTGGIGVQVP